jgi:hypothetical protein
MAAFELGDPVPLFVLVEAHDAPLHPGTLRAPWGQPQYRLESAVQTVNAAPSRQLRRGNLMSKRFVVALSASCLLALAAIAQAQTTAQRIQGDVVSLDGRSLAVKTRAGSVVTVRLADNVRISARSASSLDAIVPGAFLGTTAVPGPDGTLSATEVHLFPESMRGTGEGHRPMDIQPGATMTNATVTSVAAARTKSASTTTNATVADVAASGSERRIALKYKDGEKIVVVGNNVPVVMVEPGDLSMLTPGAHVLVTAAKELDGTLTSDRVSVGKNGLVPPI